MSKSADHPATIPWLLEGGDPSVRFFTLTDLLGVVARLARRCYGAPPDHDLRRRAGDPRRAG